MSNSEKFLLAVPRKGCTIFRRKMGTNENWDSRCEVISL